VFDSNASMPRINRGMVYLGACLVAGIRLAREKQVNVRVIPTSQAMMSSWNSRMRFSIACFGRCQSGCKDDKPQSHMQKPSPNRNDSCDGNIRSQEEMDTFAIITWGTKRTGRREDGSRQNAAHRGAEGLATHGAWARGAIT
jgi:hypothetical protein